MNCEYCGAALPANANNCPACGAAVTNPVAAKPTTNAALTPGAKIPNYLVWSILTTIFCCVPCGIAAIVYSSKVSTLEARGDYAGAQAASSKAKLWCIVSAVLGAIIGIIAVAAGD